MTSQGTCGGTLLLVLPVPFRRDASGELLFEAQACNGLDRWADNFSRVIVACPVLPGVWDATSQSTSAGYCSVHTVQAFDRIEFVPLPAAYTALSFARHMASTRRLLAEKIDAADYLSFAIGGLFGDWGAVAALVAAKKGKRYSIWTDRVEHRVVKTSHADSRGFKRLIRKLKNRIVISPLMKRLELHVIRRAELGLFHGRDCFDAYSPHCRSPHVVHDIHLKARDRIGDAELAQKQSRSQRNEPLKIVYAGRAAEMKGPDDWLQAMSALAARGVSFQATWMGDGPLLDGLRREVARLGLEASVRFVGNVSERASVLQALRDADLFVFCHRTPESPRCLIEALMAGTPIVGYDMPYPRDLLGGHASELLVPLNDSAALAARMADLAGDRTGLANWAATAAEIGAGFSDDEVFKHRSDLIKRYLS